MRAAVIAKATLTRARRPQHFHDWLAVLICRGIVRERGAGEVPHQCYPRRHRLGVVGEQGAQSRRTDTGEARSQPSRLVVHVCAAQPTVRASIQRVYSATCGRDQVPMASAWASASGRATARRTTGSSEGAHRPCGRSRPRRGSCSTDRAGCRTGSRDDRGCAQTTRPAWVPYPPYRPIMGVPCWLAERPIQTQP